MGNLKFQTKRKKKGKKKSWGTRNTYRGVDYRSYWETYLAMLLAYSGIKFGYEVKRYFLKEGLSYLPDFYLPEYRCFIEVKGFLKDDDKVKMTLFKIKITNRLIYFGENEIEFVFGDKAAKIAKINFDTYLPNIDEVRRFHEFLRREIRTLNKGVYNGKE